MHCLVKRCLLDECRSVFVPADRPRNPHHQTDA
jgi:hypothetical protein